MSPHFVKSALGIGESEDNNILGEWISVSPHFGYVDFWSQQGQVRKHLGQADFRESPSSRSRSWTSSSASLTSGFCGRLRPFNLYSVRAKNLEPVRRPPLREGQESHRTLSSRRSQISCGSSSTFGGARRLQDDSSDCFSWFDGDTDFFGQSKEKVVDCVPSVRLQVVDAQESV